MTSIGEYKQKTLTKKSESSKAGLSKLMNFVHNGSQSEDIPKDKKKDETLDLKDSLKEKEALLEKKFKQKEAKLLKELEAKLRKANKQSIEPTANYKVISPTPSPKTYIQDGEDKIKNETVLNLISNYSKWDTHTKRLFHLVAQKTNYGSIKDVHIGRREIEKTIHSSFLKISKEVLLNNGIISIQEGYTSSSKRVTLFYTLNLQNLLQ